MYNDNPFESYGTYITFALHLHNESTYYRTLADEAQHTLDEFGVKDMTMRSVLVDRLIAARCTADQCERTEKGFLECLTDEARKELLEEINRYDENCNERKAG